MVMDTRIEKVVTNLNQKLDEFLILFSQKFQISILAKCFSKGYSDSLKRQASIGDVPDDYLTKNFWRRKLLKANRWNMLANRKNYMLMK